MNIRTFTFADLRGLSSVFSRAPDRLRSRNKGGAAPLKGVFLYFPLTECSFRTNDWGQGPAGVRNGDNSHRKQTKASFPSDPDTWAGRHSLQQECLKSAQGWALVFNNSSSFRGVIEPGVSNSLTFTKKCWYVEQSSTFCCGPTTCTSCYWKPDNIKWQLLTSVDERATAPQSEG